MSCAAKNNSEALIFWDEKRTWKTLKIIISARNRARATRVAGEKSTIKPPNRMLAVHMQQI